MKKLPNTLERRELIELCEGDGAVYARHYGSPVYHQSDWWLSSPEATALAHAEDVLERDWGFDLLFTEDFKAELVTAWLGAYWHELEEVEWEEAR